MAVEARKLKGFRDYLPQAARVRNAIIAQARDIAALSGFQPVDTPALEYADVLLGLGSEDTDKEVYRFKDHGDRDVALRFDLTVPFARLVSESFNDLPMPFKRFQSGDVWRGEKPQKGRYRQFCQADIDIIGVDSLNADVEVLSTLANIYGSVLNKPIQISINNRIILSALIQKFLKADKATETKTIIAIDKLKKIGDAKVAELIATQTNANPKGVGELLAIITQKSSIDQLSSIVSGDAAQEVARLKTTLELLEKLNVHKHVSFKVDLSLARGLAYYTGIVFEAVLSEQPDFGSIGGGGRYNQLVERFGKQDLAGVGGSVGVDRLLAALEESGVAADTKPTGVYVCLASDGALAYGFDILKTLRTNNIVADIALKGGKMGNQLKHAARLNYQYAIIVGEDEQKQKAFTLKNLATHAEEKNIPLKDLLKSVN